MVVLICVQIGHTCGENACIFEVQYCVNKLNRLAGTINSTLFYLTYCFQSCKLKVTFSYFRSFLFSFA